MLFQVAKLVVNCYSSNRKLIETEEIHYLNKPLAFFFFFKQKGLVIITKSETFKTDMKVTTDNSPQIPMGKKVTK